MKEYVDEKFWRMFSGFITLIAVSLVILIMVRVYKDKDVSVVNAQTSTIINNQ
ncbi:MAG: hypothetical protein ACYCZW_01765 [Minisyncoccota bacterium]